MAIQSFASRKVERFFLEGRLLRTAGWTGVGRVAARKLDMLDYAQALRDLAAPPATDWRR